MRRRWTVHLAATGAALAVVAFAAVAVVWVVTSEPEPPLPDLPPLAPTAVWLGPGEGEADGAGAPAAGQVLGIASRGSTMVAVGSVVTPGGTPDRPTAERAIWRSADDGATWFRVAVGGDGVLTAVTATREGFVAAGTRTGGTGDDGVHAVVMASSDGMEWSDQPIDGAGVRLSAAVAGSSGAVLAGSREDGGGRVPYALVRDGDGWRGSPVGTDGGRLEGEVNGGCRVDDEVVLVGTALDTRAVRRPLVLRSPDGGTTWAGQQLGGSPLDEGAATAVGCASAGGRVTVGGNVVVGARHRAFVAVEPDESGAWEAELLPGRHGDAGPGRTARAITGVGDHVVVVGEDLSDRELGPGAVWLTRGNDPSRLAGLEELLAQDGPREATAIGVHRGLLVIGTGAKVSILRSSLDRAFLASTAPPRTLDWWEVHASVDPCTLLEEVDVATLSGRSDLTAQPSPVTEGYVTCAWGDEYEPLVVTVELAPTDRLARLASVYERDLEAPFEVTSSCLSATYYPAFRTVAARCGETAVAVSGIDGAEAGRAIDTVAPRLPTP